MNSWTLLGAALVGSIAAMLGVGAAADPYATAGRHLGHALGYGLIVGVLFGAGLGLAAGLAAGLAFSLPYALGAAEMRFLRRRGSL